QHGKLIIRMEQKSELRGYAPLVKAVQELHVEFPQEMALLQPLLIDVMLRGGIERAQQFFEEQPALFDALKDICDLDVYPNIDEYSAALTRSHY
ncbi:MAG TPA: hypothetical protein VJB65_02560, partial [Patescibacteria group bacterium]|nr:hypothetical protein [Patescibacteria group bacterium]